MKFLRLNVLAGAFITAACGVGAGEHGSEKRNIVVFLTDDHSLLDTSLYGSDRGFSTPHMDRLAKAGMVFNQAYVASPSCAPSRASLLTGLMPARHGAEENHAKPLPELKKWPAYFQELGYEVVAFGKVSHYKHTADYGFDSFAHDTFHDHESIPAAEQFIAERDKRSTRPLCLMVGSNWPHVPWPKESKYEPGSLKLPEPSVGTTITHEARTMLAAAVDHADADLGTIYDAVRRHMPAETIFLFSTDHGTQWPFGKWNCYEEGVHVPLIVDWPGVTKPGAKVEAMVSWVDFLPTLLEAIGGKAPGDIDGRSFVSVLRGEKDQHRDRIFTTHSGDGNWNSYPIRSIRNGNWKPIWNLYPDLAFTSHIDLPGKLGRTNYWDSWESLAQTNGYAAAIVQKYYERPQIELYDIATDPHELANLADNTDHAERVAQMKSELEIWIKEQGDQRKIYGKPRKLTDTDAYGPDAKPVY